MRKWTFLSGLSSVCVCWPGEQNIQLNGNSWVSSHISLIGCLGTLMAAYPIVEAPWQIVLQGCREKVFTTERVRLYHAKRSTFLKLWMLQGDW